MSSEPFHRATGTVSGAMLLALAVGSVLTPSASAQQPRSEPATAATKLHAADKYGKLPLAFEANQGQAEPGVKFLSRGSGYTLLLTLNEAVLALKKPQTSNGPSAASRQMQQATNNEQRTADSILRIKLAGVHPEVTAQGTDELLGKSNYFMGTDPAKWLRDVPNYARVRYHAVYPGVDLVYYGNQRRLEYDFIVAPGADPGRIKLDLGGSSEPSDARRLAPLRIDHNGDLVVTVDGTEVRFDPPVIYQLAAIDHSSGKDGRTPVSGHYRLVGHRLTFKVGPYDRTRPLTIDPALNLTYSTYLGGSGDDTGQGIAIDSAGNTYITGQTTSTNFPTVAGGVQTTYGGGSSDAYVTKLNATGTAAIYSTYLGGSGGDSARSIAVDASGNTYIMGTTDSANFPTTTGAVQTTSTGQSNDAFVTKLSPSGSSLVYSTYLGGSADEYGNSIAIDPSGNAYVFGTTFSTDFPVTAGAFQTTPGGGGDAFVAKLNATGSALTYSTYLGGSGSDNGAALALDSAGNAYVAGFTSSTNFPTTPGAFQTTGGTTQDAFVTKLNASGTALVYSTYLGGDNTDAAYGVALDSADNAYVVGWTTSANFPTTPSAFQPIGSGSLVDSVPDAFVTKLNPTGSALVYSTYLGGCGNDQAYGVAVNSSGNAYVTGTTNSSDFPPNLVGECKSDWGYSPFLSKFDSTGSALIYSNYIEGLPSSGPFGSPPVQGNGIVLDSAGNAFIAGTTNSPFQTTTGAFQSSYGGGNTDAFVLSFANTPQSFAVFSPASLTISGQAVGTTSPAQPVTFTNGGDAALIVSSTSITGDFAQTNNCPLSPATLGAGVSCAINVTFTPTAVGSRTGTLTVASDAANAVQSITVTGTGTSGAVTLSATSLTFSPQHQGTTSAPQMVTLTNSGTTALTVNSVTTSTSVFGQSNNCPVAPATLAAGQSCVINVTFTPSAVGANTGSLTISDSALNSPQVVTLTGTGGGPANATVAPASLTFGSQPVMTTSAAQTVTVTNTGTVTLSITSITASGDFAETNNCGSIVPQGSSCTVNVTFTPTAAGSLSGTLTIADNALVSPAVVNLTGTATAPTVSLSSTSLTFADQGVGTTSAVQSVTLSNTGNASLTVTSIKANGDFAETNTCGTSVAAGGSCAIKVTFTPSTDGSRTGTVTITDNAAGSPQSVSLTGTGAVAYSLSATASSATVVKGTDSATFSVNVSTTFGFTGSVSLACSGNAPAICSFSPASAAPGHSSTLTVSGLTGVSSSSLSFTAKGTNGNQSVSLPLSVLISDFSLTASSTSATVVAGQSATYSLSLAPVQGFNQAVSLACSGLPAASTCTVAPASVTPSGSAASKVTVTVATTARSTGQPQTRFHPPSAPGASWVRWLPWLLALLMIFSLAAGRRRARLAIVAALLSVMIWAGCGGSSSTPSGTPAGDYTLTITGTSGTLSHSLTLTLTVN